MIAAKGEGDFIQMRAHVSRQGHGQVEAHGDVPPAMILKAVYLLVGLAAALSEEHLAVLKHGRIYWHEAELPALVLNAAQNLPPKQFLRRHHIPEALQNQRFNYHRPIIAEIPGLPYRPPFQVDVSG